MSFTDRIRALPAAAQIALAAATALVIVGVMVGAWLVMRPKYEVLFRDLRPADAATIVAELEKQKVPFRLDDGGATILAPAANVDETRLAIMGADLPLKGTVGFELFNKSDMGLTEFAQRINYQRALQGELARTIMTMDAVDTARVHLTLPEPSIFRADRKPAKASVTLTTRPGRSLTPEMIAGVQRLVGASVPELDVANVVILGPQGLLTAAQPQEPIDEVAPAGLQQVRGLEEFYAAGLRAALEPLYPGVRVAVLIPADQWPAGDRTARDAALSRWSPGGRDFRLQVDVSAPEGLDDRERDDIGRIIAAQPGWSFARGDALLFSDWTSEGVATPSNAGPILDVGPPPPVQGAPARLTPKADIMGYVWAGLVIAIMTLVGVLLYRRRNQGGSLTPEQREAYIRRLKRLLAEDAHAG